MLNHLSIKGKTLVLLKKSIYEIEMRGASSVYYSYIEHVLFFFDSAHMLVKMLIAA